MLLHKPIVLQVRVGGGDPIQLFGLPGAQTFLRVEAPDAFQQALAAKHLVNAGELIGI